MDRQCSKKRGRAPEPSAVRMLRLRQLTGGPRALAASGGIDGPITKLLDLNSPAALFYVPTLAANAAVFGLWQLAARPTASSRFVNVMSSYFMTSPQHLRRLPWAAAPFHWLGSSFSHSGGLHFGVNMFALSSFAWGLMEPSNSWQPRMELGAFAATYAAGGLAGGLASNLWGMALRTNIPSLGASGAVFAVATAYLQAVPGAGIRLFFLAPMSGGSAVLALGGLNVALMLAQAMRFRIGIDGAGHLGGMLAGAAAAEMWKSSDGWKTQMRRAIEQASRDRW